MMLVYPVGIPCLYAYLLFYRYGTELQVLKSLELKRCAIYDEYTTGKALEAATHAHEKTKTKRVAMGRANRRRSSDATAKPPPRRRSSAGVVMEALDVKDNEGSKPEGTKEEDAEEALPPEVAAQIEALEAEEQEKRDKLPDYIQKLIGGYELRVRCPRLRTVPTRRHCIRCSLLAVHCVCGMAGILL